MRHLKSTSVHLRQAEERYLALLSEKLGLSRSAVVRLAIRKLAEAEHISPIRKNGGGADVTKIAGLILVAGPLLSAIGEFI